MAPEGGRRGGVVNRGGGEQGKEATRDAWIGDAFVTAARELRYAGRALRRSPTFLVVAVATLAIGIGGATAVFTVIKASLFRPLPAVYEPDRLIAVEPLEQGKAGYDFSYPDFRDLSAQTTALSGLAGFDGTSMALDDGTSAARQWVSYVTGNFFAG